jgi:hypothetical protein
MQKMIYILQKDLPLSKIGEEWMERDGVYYPEFNQFITLPKTFVENNPDWFKKKEPEVCKAEILITDFGTYNKRLDKYPDKVYCINVWHDIIPESKFPAIKKAIEKVLNEEEKPVIDKATKEKYFKQVLECLKHNKVMVDTREDGIYIRLAGSESKGQAFTLHFANAFPYPELQYQQSSETLSDTVLEKERIPEAKVLSNIDAYQMGLKDGLNFASKYI